MSWRSAIIVISCAVIVMTGAAAALAATFGVPWDDRGLSGFTLVTPGPPAEPGWEPGAEVLAASGDAAPESAAGGENGAVGDALANPLDASGLGGSVGASVVDLTAATPVLDSGGDAARTPASTLKILTAVAALEVLGPDHTFATRVVTGSDGLDAPESGLTLVGGGDPTLTTGSSGTELEELADRTMDALSEAGVTTVELSYDASLFAGPAVDPDWRPSYVSSDIVSPVTALGVDVPDDRPDDPPPAAAEAFSDLLEERGISVSSTPAEAAAEDDATPVAAVRSAPLSTIVEDMLATSDNDGAEVIARHVALGSGLAGSSDDASTAIVRALDGLGIDTSATTVLDGSGLARGSAVPASVITDTLVLAADPARPQLRAAVTGLAVGGFSGTLADRLDDSAGAGVVRAKTGTLTGVSALAGVVTSADGGSYAFAVLADDVSDTLAARSALDDVAAAIAGCACG